MIFAVCNSFLQCFKCNENQSGDEDLNDYITRKTLDGLFAVMGEKESSLRGGATNILGDFLK